MRLKVNTNALSAQRFVLGCTDEFSHLPGLLKDLQILTQLNGVREQTATHAPVVFSCLTRIAQALLTNLSGKQVTEARIRPLVS